MSTVTIASHISVRDGFIEPLTLAAPLASQRPDFFGAIAHAVEHAYLNYAQGSFGPGVITSKDSSAALGHGQANPSSIGDLLSVRRKSFG